MLVHQLTTLLRRPCAGLAQATLTASAAVAAASRKPPNYDNYRIRSRKYKSLAKLNRKMKRAGALSGSKNPRDFGEEMPPFYAVQPRYKLLYKLIQTKKNATLVQRKPFPEETKQEFIKASKEYHAYKLAEKTQLTREHGHQLEVQIKALDSTVFLPDYLLEEVLNIESGGEQLS